MLRALFIYLSKAAWARQLVTRWGFAWRAASRFVAGETLEAAIRAAQELNQKGIVATLDNLGEHTNTLEEARQARDGIARIVDAIEQAEVRANISIKLTQIGLALDEEACGENLAFIVQHAAQHGIFVRIDMEDSPWTDATIRLYQRMRTEYGLDNVGVVIQSYLYRSEADIRSLSTLGTRVRLCKGAYKEPADIAFPKKSDVDANYDKLGELLMDCAMEAGAQPASPDGKVPPIPALATHDDARIEHARAYAQKIGLPKQVLEFQFLYGIRRDLQESLVKEGFPVRVYVPYGTEWYPYFVRRLAERPANLWFFISNFFKG
jgi:proline dehydrogenase